MPSLQIVPPFIALELVLWRILPVVLRARNMLPFVGNFHVCLRWNGRVC